jgi:hypothetical protein
MCSPKPTVKLKFSSFAVGFSPLYFNPNSFIKKLSQAAILKELSYGIYGVFVKKLREILVRSNFLLTIII